MDGQRSQRTRTVQESEGPRREGQAGSIQAFSGTLGKNAPFIWDQVILGLLMFADVAIWKALA